MSNNAALLMLCFFFSSSYPHVFSRYCFIPLNPTCANFLSSCSPPTHLHPPHTLIMWTSLVKLFIIGGSLGDFWYFYILLPAAMDQSQLEGENKKKKKRKATSNCHQAQRSIQPVYCLRKHHGSVISFQNLVK